MVQTLLVQDTDGAVRQLGPTLSHKQGAVFIEATLVITATPHFVVSEGLTFVHLPDLDLVNLTEVSFEPNIVRINRIISGDNTHHALVTVVSDESSGAVMHDGLVVVLLSIAHGPSVGGELLLVFQGNIVPLYLQLRHYYNA